MRLRHCFRHIGKAEATNGAASLALTPDELSNIGSAVSGIPVQGARYPENLAKLVGR